MILHRQLVGKLDETHVPVVKFAALDVLGQQPGIRKIGKSAVAPEIGDLDAQSTQARRTIVPKWPHDVSSPKLVIATAAPLRANGFGLRAPLMLARRRGD